MIKISGFAPDLDSTEPGLIVDCANLVPTPAGYRSGASEVSTGTPSLAAECRGASVARKLDNSKRIFAGTQTGLFELIGSAWSDISKAGGYLGGVDSRWRFSQFGDVSIAADGVSPLQFSASGAFADISGAPKARLVETVSGFVVIAATEDTTYGVSPDRWWCSALYDYADWAPALSTQCTTGRLVDTPGPITALRRLGGDLVAYKDRAMYLGRYVGTPVVWQWTLIPGEIGTPSGDSVVDIGSAHIFVGPDDIYLFDGSRPQAVGGAIKEWFFARLNASYRYKVQLAHDRTKSLVRIYYPSISSSSGAIDECLVYHYPTGKWGRQDRVIESVVDYTTPSTTLDDLGAAYATFNDLPVTAFDSPAWVAESVVPGVFNSAHVLVQLNGTPSESSLTTGDVGEDDVFWTLQRVTPKFLKVPTNSTMTNLYRNSLGDSLVEDQTSQISNGRFDVIRSARWHRIRLDTTGDMEISAFKPYYRKGGID